MTTEGLKGTKIALGQANERGYIGRFYIANTGGGMLHPASRCTKLASSDINPVQVYDYDGVQSYEFDGTTHIVTRVCTSCPPAELDNTWQDRAVCYDTFTDGEDFFTTDVEEQDWLIAQYCDSCPVTIECLIAGLDADAGGIHGGLAIPFDKAKRKEFVREWVHVTTHQQ